MYFIARYNEEYSEILVEVKNNMNNIVRTILGKLVMNPPQFQIKMNHCIHAN